MPSGIPIVNDLVTGGADKALSAEQGKNLGAIINGGHEIIDLSLLTQQNCSLGNSNWYYGSGNVGHHKAISVTPGENLELEMTEYNGYTTGNYNGWYVFVTSSYSPPYSNGNAIPKTGTDSRIAAPLGEVIELVAPENAAYLIITTQDGAGIYPTWVVERVTSFGLTHRVSELESKTDDIEELVSGEVTEQTGEFGEWRDSGTTPNRAFAINAKLSKAGGVITLKLSSYTTYKIGIAIQNGTAYSSTVIYESGWKTSDIVKTISASEEGYNIRVSICRVDNTSLSMTEFLSAITEMSYTFVAGQNGLSQRVEALEDESVYIPQRIPIDNIGTALYRGKKIDVAEHSYTYETIGTLTNTGSYRQGAAVFGDYLFQCHNTNNYIVVFKLSSGLSIQTISLTAIADCHANSAEFGNQYYDQSDPFPCLYISSEGESKSYVYRITGTEGNYSATLVQTISFSVPYYYPNMHIDGPNNRGIVVGYKENSYSVADGNNMMACCFSLPSVVSGNATLSKPYGEFSFPFMYATQGACAKYGKLYHAFGNTSQGLAIGGIVVVDYLLKNVESYLDLKAVGNFEPEGIGIYEGGFVITTQSGSVIKITPQ